MFKFESGEFYLINNWVQKTLLKRGFLKSTIYYLQLIVLSKTYCYSVIAAA